MKLQNVLIAGALLYGTVYGLYGNVELIPEGAPAAPVRTKSEMQSQIGTRLSTGTSVTAPAQSRLFGQGPYSMAPSHVTRGGGGSAQGGL